jgi:hypothetical protein
LQADAGAGGEDAMLVDDVEAGDDGRLYCLCRDASYGAWTY